MTATISPPNQADEDRAVAPSAPHVEGRTGIDQQVIELGERLESETRRRDGGILVACVLSAIAMVASVVSVGLGMRAVSESKRSTSAATSPTSAVPATSAPPKQVAGLPATLTDFKVEMPAAAFAAGPLTLSISNTGALPHELLAFRSDLAASAYPVDADGKILEEDSAITLVSDGENIEPGGSQHRTFDLSVPGTYLFVCNLPGHFKAGMFTQVVVP